MRGEKEGGKKQARVNKQQSKATQHTKGRHFSEGKISRLGWDSNPRYMYTCSDNMQYKYMYTRERNKAKRMHISKAKLRIIENEQLITNADSCMQTFSPVSLCTAALTFANPPARHVKSSPMAKKNNINVQIHVVCNTYSMQYM